MPSPARRWTGEPAPAITVAADRAPAVIAREIVRRLLPEAQRYWERQEEREARLVAYETATAETVQRLSTIGITLSEGTRYPTDSDVRLYAYLDALRIEAKVYGDTVDLDFKGLSSDLAVALLTAVNTAKSEKVLVAT